MNRLLTRVLTAVVAIPVFATAVYLGHVWLGLVVLAMGLVGYHEFSRLWAAKGVVLLPALGYGGTALWIALGLARNGDLGSGLQHAAAVGGMGLWLTLLVCVALGVIVFGFGRYAPDAILLTLGGTLYTGWLLSHLLLLRGMPAADGSLWHGGFGLVAFAFLCIWTTDSLAYFTGAILGKLGVTKHKLAPTVSPGKSIEGLMGGFACSSLVGWLMGPVVGLGAGTGLALGAAIALLGHLGDLAESGLKRFAGVKDSGHLIPGHGGVLDRFDSSLVVLPVVYYVVTLLR